MILKSQYIFNLNIYLRTLSFYIWLICLPPNFHYKKWPQPELEVTRPSLKSIRDSSDIIQYIITLCWNPPCISYYMCDECKSVMIVKMLNYLVLKYFFFAVLLRKSKLAKQVLQVWQWLANTGFARFCNSEFHKNSS